MYDPYMFTMFLRKAAPGFTRLGAPTKVRDEYGPEQMRKKNLAIVKTKDELLEEHSLVMQKVYQRSVLGLLAVIVGAYAFYNVLFTGSEVYLMAAMAAVGWGMYKWWHAAAAYSNYQEFEMRPILVPVEDIREPSVIPHWLSGKAPAFEIQADHPKQKI